MVETRRSFFWSGFTGFCPAHESTGRAFAGGLAHPGRGHAHGFLVGVGGDSICRDSHVATCARYSCGNRRQLWTPPNAIVYGSGHITLPQMLRAGFLLNIGAFLLLCLWFGWLVPTFFPLLSGEGCASSTGGLGAHAAWRDEVLRIGCKRVHEWQESLTRLSPLAFYGSRISLAVRRHRDRILP